MLFIDFSSAFNTIIPQQLINKLSLLGLNNSLCNWILDFLTGRPQSVRVGHNTSSTTTLSTGGPTGLCAQPAALHAADPRLHCQVQLQPHHQVRRWHISGRVSSATTMKRTTERKWHSWLNGVALTTCPSMWRRQRRLWWTSGETPLTTPHWPSTPRLWRESAALIPGVHITEDLTWTTNTKSVSKKAQQRLHFLRRLKKSKPPSTHPHQPSTGGTIESVLTSCITVWYGNCCAADRKTLQRTVKHRCKNPLVPLSPHILDIFFLTRCSSKAKSIVEDPPTPPTVSSSSYPSGRRLPEYQSPAPPDCSTAFSPRLWETLTPHHTAPLWNPKLTHPPPPPLPPPPPPPYHISGKKLFKLLSLWNSGWAGLPQAHL